MAVVVQVATRPTNGKAGKGGKKGRASVTLSIGDSNGLDEALVDEPEAAPARKSTKGKKKQGAAAGAFAALDLSDGDSDCTALDDAPDSPVAAPARKAKKGKKKHTSAAAGAFAALDVSDEEETGNLAVPEDAPKSPPAASARKPKKGKKKGFDASSAFAVLDIEEDDQTDAAEPAVDIDEAEDAAAAAAPPTRKARKGKKKGFDASSAFAALDIEDDDQKDAAEPAVSVSDEAEEAPAAAQPTRKSKNAKKNLDPHAAFAALDDDSADQPDALNEAVADADAEGTPVSPATKPKKGKKKTRADAAAAYAQLGLDAAAEEAVGTAPADAADDSEHQALAAGDHFRTSVEPVFVYTIIGFCTAWQTAWWYQASQTSFCCTACHESRDCKTHLTPPDTT